MVADVAANLRGGGRSRSVKRPLCRCKCLAVPTTRSTALSILALGVGYLVAGRLALELLVCLGCLRLPNHVMLTLAAFASLSFVTCSLMLRCWRPTEALGHMLVDRILSARTNWETDSLRSFSEVGLWLSVIWSTYEATDGGISGSVVSLLCGTIAGVLLAVVGEALKAPLRDLEQFLRALSAGYSEGEAETYEDEKELLESGSVFVLALFGYSAINTIYENVTDVVVACGLAVLGGLGILTLAKAAQFWEPTRRIGVTMQCRVLGTIENWRSYPIRSALESTFFGGMVLGVYTLEGSVVRALQVGTLSGVAVMLGSELFAHGVALQGCVKRPKSEKEGPHLLVPLVLACIFFVIFVVIFATQERQIADAALCALVNSIAWVSIGRICLSWSSTRHVANVINDRMVNTVGNWVEFPLRSLMEISVWILAQFVCLRATDWVLIAAIAGTSTGLVAVLACEAMGWGRLPRKGRTSGKQHTGSGEGSVEDRVFTWAEVAVHDNCDDAWLVIDGKVYDVTDWAPQHPGGSIIHKFAGVDASDQFAAFHQPRVAKRLRRFLVGRVPDDEQSLVKPSGATLEYRALRERLWREGYFVPRRSYFLAKAFVCLAAGAASLSMALCLPSWSWTRLIGSALLLGLTWQQVGFFTHDVAHNGVMAPKNGGGFNWLACILGSGVFGISSGMWQEEHSLHHAITLRPCEDPQFNYLPLWLISMKELDVPGVHVTSLMRFLVSIQQRTFLVVPVLFGRLVVHVISVVWALKAMLAGSTPSVAFIGLADLLGLAFYCLWYCTLVSQFESWPSRALFVLVSYCTAGILHMQLIISHMGTESFTAEEERAEQFFAFQLKTTRNLDATWYDHWLHGGLEFQIEHHLFPQLPRHNLGKVKPMVQEICLRHGIPYRSKGFLAVVHEVLQDLGRLKRELAHLSLG